MCVLECFELFGLFVHARCVQHALPGKNFISTLAMCQLSFDRLWIESLK